MIEIIEIKLLLLLLTANGAPILARLALDSRFSFPLDGGKKTSTGRPILGASKTYRGVLAAILSTAMIAPWLGFSWGFGATIGMLAMAGDLLASFTKRRLGLPSSSQAMGLDQIPESLIPLIYGKFILNLAWLSVLATVLAFWIGEILLSLLLFRLGIRRHPY